MLVEVDVDVDVDVDVVVAVVTVLVLSLSAHLFSSKTYTQCVVLTHALFFKTSHELACLHAPRFCTASSR